MESWHNQDDFWTIAEPILFSWQRRAEASGEAEDISKLLQIKPPGKILDMCCGIGRHSLELARSGFEVTGVDRTQVYLDKAEAQAKTEKLKVEFVNGDMRTFVRPDTYDTALSLYTSFGYFEDPEDDRRVVNNLYASLKLDGMLLFDMIGKEVLARIFRERDWYEEDGCLVLQERTLGTNWDWIQNRWILLKDDSRTELQFSHRLYSASEIVTLLKECGFSYVKMYGDFKGSSYNHQANRLVAVARK